MQQYLQIKARYLNEIVFFRLGDFYEMFFEDAIKAAPLLEVALTKRQSTPMCGVPHHALNGYVAKLLKAGISVALAEQLEDPKKTKGMVKRDVVRVITPGTILEDELLSSKVNNFLLALGMRNTDQNHWAVAVADVSTGRQWIGDVKNDLHWSRLKSQLAVLNPSEVLLVGETTQKLAKFLSFRAVTRLEPKPPQSLNYCDQVKLALENYLKRNQSNFSGSLGRAEPLPAQSSGVMLLDESAVWHLELVESSDPLRNGPTLLSVIDQTRTPLGSRQLRWWLLHPSNQKSEIQMRQNQVEALVEDSPARTSIREALKDVSDVERIMVRSHAGTVSPRECAALRHTLQMIPSLEKKCDAINAGNVTHPFSEIKNALVVPEELNHLLTTQLSEDPPAKLTDGGIIREGTNRELDELRSLRRQGRKWIAEMEATEREKTKITNLKVGYNDVFGYFLEVSKSHLSKVPTDWIRKQTLTNAERFVTPSLKEQEEKILGAQEKILALEKKLFSDLVRKISTFSIPLSIMAQAIAHLDVVAGLSDVAVEKGYTRPEIFDSDVLRITKGRHPVIENQIGPDRFIPNDLDLGGDGKRISILTGPNMAGKSTYLRQTALIVILAQIGSFVPSASAQIGLVDRIFTRIGASDRLSQGQSTFMVEMNEVANLLLNATGKSLVVLDEVGRGTSTYDGVSIAWAVVDHLSQSKGPRTLFATHYFELTQLPNQIPTVMNMHATAKEWPGPDGRRQVVFLYQILPGPADRSYGIHVAEMAGIPDGCIRRARDILKQLESGNHQLSIQEREKNGQPQLDLFSRHPVIDDLQNLRVEEMTPLEALNKLADLKKRAD